MNEDINRILEIGASPGPSAGEDAAVVPENIGGWLVLPAIGLVLGVVVSVIGIFISLAVAAGLPSQYQGVFALNLLADAGLTAFLIYAAILFFGKRRNAPAVMITLMIANVVVNGLLLAIDIGADAEPFAMACGRTMVGGIISGAIWIPYFRVSERVKRTFVAL